ncbi:hypothetical protein ASD77_08750 [Pseudoxanthomonas sp. Root65]|uniref:SH3 domain-containing protein n=1 Tax=Pseudoxanthomonas sp. Root65 TaxID=1736576 RepID=UPI0006F823B3|nr:SH3 domain-containing protein [Pseudoxanthomonas sp. Root65]KRA54663.1 hypothetical protein ASD77_08750 [Pseudoxanthomonas sp. Root65]
MPAARALLFALLMAAGSAAAGNDPVLAPPAEALPPAAEAMRDELQRIVAARDLQALRAHVREDTTLSFGGDSGPQGFDAVWATDAAATRALWRVLDALLALPGVARSEEGKDIYCAPYVFCLPYPADIDVFDAQVVLGRDVAVRAQPGPQAPVVTRVSHVVLTALDDATGASTPGWVHVRLASGQQGYVAGTLLRSPLDYRLSLVSEGDGRWRIQYFVAGD